MAEFLDLAFKGFCILAALVTIGSLVGSYWQALRAYRELSREIANGQG